MLLLQLPDINGLNAGSYTVTVTDANGCTATSTATITEPAALVLATTTMNVSCNGGSDGSVDLELLRIPTVGTTRQLHQRRM